MGRIAKSRNIPIADVVVFAVHAVQVPLDRVPAVVEHEDDRLKLRTNHDRQLLDRQLAG